MWPDPACPPAEETRQTGQTSPYARNAIGFVRDAVASQPPVALHAALGVDISYPFTERFETPPEFIHETVAEAVDAGVSAVILCREYQEISGRSMRTAREALSAKGILSIRNRCS